ncbi:PLDc N-terminal domain-containing protein [Candidatus Pacearchaeota archaeon]|nr:PLDc N-terminal domain-containing protein [Candidatus Pacearchaeota archaeon]
MVFELATLGPSMILLAVILFLLIIGLIVFLFVFWILMIIDAAKRKFKNDNDRVIWILIIVLLGMLGAIIYYFAIKMPDKH